MNQILDLDAASQVEALKSRGWKITNEEKAIATLNHVSLVHLSVLNPNFKYLCNADFESVLKINRIDTDLRRALFQSIEVFEISFRRNLGLFFSMKYGSLGYENKSNFLNEHEHKKWFNGIRKKLESKNLMDNELLPLPVIIEDLTFTGLKVFFENLSKEDKSIVSRKYQVGANKLLTWLAMLREVRNACAHHDVIWNKTFMSKSEEHQIEKDFRWLPPLVLDGAKKEKSIFYVILVLTFLLKKVDLTSYYLGIFKSILSRLAELPLISRNIQLPQKWNLHPLLMVEI